MVFPHESAQWNVDEYPAYAYIRKEKLIEILQALPEGALVQANRLGNLNVFDKLSDDGMAFNEWLGYLEISSENYERII